MISFIYYNGSRRLFNLTKYASIIHRCINNTKVENIATANHEMRRDLSDSSDDELSYKVGSLFGNMKSYLKKYMVQGVTAKNLYEVCADGISYEEFFKACKMPDTFQSWFYVMHLHVWMLLVRLKVEGKIGKNISYHMVDIMWKDVEERMKLLGLEDNSERRETLEELAQQFFGLIIAYDEGLVSHDRVLASALWRNLFYNKQNTDAESLALLVCYVRKQVQYLDIQSSDEIILNGKIDWLPLHSNNAVSSAVS